MQIAQRNDLSKLAMEVRREKNLNPGRVFYSEKLKSEIVALKVEGMSASAVAEATGVSKCSVNLWAAQYCKQVPMLRRLEVLESSEKKETSFLGDKAKKEHFSGGIKICLPNGVKILTSALNEDVLKMLWEAR
jgi:transposase-like protein